jgi:hypothetical protein
MAMNTMNAVTAMELEAARRREVLMETRTAAVAAAPQIKLDRTARREPAWLAATLSVVAAGARVARG